MIRVDEELRFGEVSPRVPVGLLGPEGAGDLIRRVAGNLLLGCSVILNGHAGGAAMMDEGHVMEARRRHAVIAPWIRTGAPILAFSAPRRLVQKSRDSDAPNPPRDYTELRDLGCGREEWDCVFADSRLPDLRDVHDHAELVGYRLRSRARDFERRSDVHRLAWEGLSDIVRPGNASRGPWVDEEMVEPRAVRRAIRTIVPYLVVPDLEGCAYPLLFCIVVNGPTVGTERWIAVQMTRDRESERERIYLTLLDRHLAQLGFEVYRVAEGWLRIDPMRAMLTLLRRAGVVDAAPRLRGEILATIGDYACASCGYDMVRLEPNDIEELVHPGYDKLVAVHAFCVEDAREGQWNRRRTLVA